MDRMGNARKGIGFGIINNILNVFLPFISRTIIIYTLGTQYLGLGGLFTSIINVLNISELGFSAAVSYILYKPVAEGDNDKICAILSFARKCFTVIGTVILVGGLAVMPFLEFLISGDVPSDINIYLLYLIFLANVVVSYYMFAYKRILFSANQRYDIETNIASVSLLIQYVLQIILLLIFKNYYFYVVITPLMTIFNNLMCQHLSKKLYPQCFCRGKISKQEVVILKKKVGGSFFSKLGETVYLSVDNIVISAIFGLQILGQYGNYYYVITSLIAIFAIVHNTMRPIIGNCIATDNKQVNFSRFLKFNNIYMWISAFCSCCLLCLYQDFILVWVGKENMFSFIMVILFVAYFFAGRLSCVPALFVEASGLWWEGRFVAMTAAIVNLTLNIILSYTIGLEGVLISSIISSVGVTFIGRIAILFKYYFDKKERLKYTKATIGILTAAIICVFITFFITKFITVNSFLTLILKGILVVLIFGIMYFAIHCKNKDARKIWALAASFIGVDKIFKKFKQE